MAKLSMIDSTKPFTIAPHTRGTVVDPELKKLASSMRMPQLLQVDEPTTDAEQLSIAETGNFIAWLMSSRWGRRLEEDLQGMAQDNEGRPFLTTWLTAGEFELFVRDAQSGPFGPRLQESRNSWVALGMDMVYFEGYELVASGG